MYSWQCLVICQPICMLAHDFCYTFPCPGLSCSCVAARTFSTSLVLAEWLHLSRTENKQTLPLPLQGTRSACVYLSCFRHATSSTPRTPPPSLTSPFLCASCSIYFCHYISESSCRSCRGARNKAGTASGPICKTIWRVPKLFKQI